MIYVKPKHGLQVRHPENVQTIIPKEGAWIAESTALTRLINDGDLVIDKHKTTPPANGKSKTAGKGDEA